MLLENYTGKQAENAAGTAWLPQKEKMHTLSRAAQVCVIPAIGNWPYVKITNNKHAPHAIWWQWRRSKRRFDWSPRRAQRPAIGRCENRYESGSPLLSTAFEGKSHFQQRPLRSFTRISLQIYFAIYTIFETVLQAYIMQRLGANFK